MTEADLCLWFQEVAQEAGFTVYNEWADYDQLLVAPDGTQIGVEAKLRANSEVLSQAIDGWQWRKREDPHDKRFSGNSWADRGPQTRAVLVPKASKAFRYIADALGVVVFAKRDYERSRWRRRRFWEISKEGRYQWGKGADLPPFIPDVVAGKPSPVRLTPWKIKAIRLCNRLRDKGFVTVRDFKEFKVSPTRWQHHWLKPDGKEGRAIKWVRKFPEGSDVKLPDEQHPIVAAQMRAADAKDG